MIVIEFSFADASLEAAGVIICGIRGNIRAMKIESNAVVKVQISLDGLQIDYAEGAHIRRIIDFVFLHHFASALDDAAYSGLSNEHVVGFLGEHEAAGPREGIEAGFRQGAELELAVAVGKEREHVEGQPVWSWLVECAENAGVIGISGAPREQRFGLFAAVASEVTVQQV